MDDPVPGRNEWARTAGAEIVSLDVLDRETLIAAGRLIWERGGAPAFGIGSQGFEAALVAHWRDAGLLPAESDLPRPRPVCQTASNIDPVSASNFGSGAISMTPVTRLGR